MPLDITALPTLTLKDVPPELCEAQTKYSAADPCALACMLSSHIQVSFNVYIYI